MEGLSLRKKRIIPASCTKVWAVQRRAWVRDGVRDAGVRDRAQSPPTPREQRVTTGDGCPALPACAWNRNQNKNQL